MASGKLAGKSVRPRTHRWLACCAPDQGTVRSKPTRESIGSYELVHCRRDNYGLLTGFIEWCFTPFSTLFRSYHGDSPHY